MRQNYGLLFVCLSVDDVKEFVRNDENRVDNLGLCEGRSFNEWSVSDFSEWLQHIGLDMYTFFVAQIDGDGTKCLWC